jgi:hypothetical protein
MGGQDSQCTAMHGVRRACTAATGGAGHGKGRFRQVLLDTVATVSVCGPGQ